MATTVVFRGGTVLTGAPGAAPVDALATRGDRIVAVGADIGSLVADGPTVTVDLGGGCLIPGFRDGHVHPLWGGVELGEAPLVGARSLDELLARVGGHAAAHPELAWIEGGGYDPSLLPMGIGEAAWLDAVVPDRPVVLEAADHHTMWVNSKALAMAGISAAMPDPDGGVIVRRDGGEPVGTLVEWGALDLINRARPAKTLAQRAEGLRRAMTELARRGITWVQEASARLEDADVYVELARRGELTTRVNLAWRAEPATWAARHAEFRSRRDAIAADPHVAASLSARTVKFFADGVIEMGTGFLLEPYVDAPHSCGLPNWTPAELAEAVTAFDADGFQIHIHAIGDGGVRMALDAIEHAMTRNGRRDRRPVIAHTQLVQPADRARFAPLGVIGNFEPLWACLDAAQTELTIPRLGPERSTLQYPIGSLARTGAAISFGSDWPVTSLNPLDGLAVAVTRQNRHGEPVDGWLPDERVPIGQALAAYTQGSAHQAFEEGMAGRLAAGQRADLCLLDRDITAMAGTEIAGVDVVATWVGGVEVHRT